MEQAIRDQYNDAILEEAIRRFGISRDQVRDIGGFESYVYEYCKKQLPYILRISHSLRRSVDQIRGEVEWINYLKDHGLNLSRAILSEAGRLVEVIGEPDSYFSAVSFEKAPGQHVTREDWNPTLFKKLGQYMGKMHAITKHYTPSESAIKRMEWDDELVDFAEKFLQPSDAGVVEKYNRLLDYLRQLPKDHDSYGLIHVDMHRGNFFVDQGEIYLFDFDDSQYGWFVYDIAIALFYAVPHHCESKEDLDAARRFYESFMEGYSEENTLDHKWLKEIPYFLKLREMDLYVVINRSFDLNNLDPWCESYMRNRKYKIENDIPYVDLGFAR